jgi:hypothetical protein
MRGNFISKYGFWILIGIFVSLVVLMFILFTSDYKQSVAIEYIWNHTIKSGEGLLCP